jgi:hypothetical protein
MLEAGKSGRQFAPLPIDNALGFPQSFAFLFGSQIYHFTLYVNVAAERLTTKRDSIELPSDEAFLVVRVDRELGDGGRQAIFLRKVVPELEYEAENITLVFPRQRVARSNLNGQGDFGSQVTGGIAPRWA